MARKKANLESSLIATIESLYRVERDSSSWLNGFNEALSAGFGEDTVGLIASINGTGAQGELETREAAIKDCAPGLVARLAQIYEGLGADYAEKVMKTQFFMATDWKFWRENMWQFKDWGAADAAVIGGRDPDGTVFGVNVMVRSTFGVDQTRRSLLTRLSAHMASAYRIRRRLNGTVLDGAVAVLDPSGKLHHVEGDAKSDEARELLRRAVTTIERARGPLRRSDPHEAVEIWRAMVRGDWTLVDCVESDGKRYVVARENAPKTKPIPELTERETQVVALANLGRHNKLIAYELGIADSTVRVLLSRAAAKLGVTSKAELLRVANDRLMHPLSGPSA